MSAWDLLVNLETHLSAPVLWDEPLSRHTFYRIGGPARALVFPKTLVDLKALGGFLRQSKVPFAIVGAGSNLLAPDEGFDGLIIKTTRLNPTMALVDGSGAQQSLLEVGAGIAVSSLLRKAGEEGWGGLEFLSGVPGNVGGAIGMNAGTHLGESASALEQVNAVGLLDEGSPLQTFTGDQLRFAYRKNNFLPQGSVVISSQWRIQKREPQSVRQVIEDTLVRRKLTQPLEYPSCGSVFKNPKNVDRLAWQVIDELGFRGKRVGDAQVAEKHSNWIINLGQARATDVWTLIESIIAAARDRMGITLEPEVKRLSDIAIELK